MGQHKARFCRESHSDVIRGKGVYRVIVSLRDRLSAHSCRDLTEGKAFGGKTRGREDTGKKSQKVRGALYCTCEKANRLKEDSPVPGLAVGNIGKTDRGKYTG